MTKPWSQAGLAADWAAIARNYVVGLAVVAGMALLVSFQCGRRSTDPAIAAEEATQHRLELALRLSEHRRDSLAQAITVLRTALTRDSAKGAALHTESLRREAGITIDTTSHFRRVASIDSAVPVDTVAYADVQRPKDERHYSIPKFFTDSYLAIRADRNAAYVTAHDQQEVIGALMSKSAVADSMQTASDSVNASLARQVATLEHERHPWCGAKCGAGITLAVLGAAAFVLRR